MAFLQARLKTAIDNERKPYEVQQLNGRLFAALLKLTWNDQVEDAAFDLLQRSSISDDPAVILSTQIIRLQQLSDAMKDGVFAVADDQLHALGPRKTLASRIGPAANKIQAAGTSTRGSSLGGRTRENATASSRRALSRFA